MTTAGISQIGIIRHEPSRDVTPIASLGNVMIALENQLIVHRDQMPRARFQRLPHGTCVVRTSLATVRKLVDYRAGQQFRQVRDCLTDCNWPRRQRTRFLRGMAFPSTDEKQAYPFLRNSIVSRSQSPK